MMSVEKKSVSAPSSGMNLWFNLLMVMVLVAVSSPGGVAWGASANKDQAVVEQTAEQSKAMSLLQQKQIIEGPVRDQRDYFVQGEKGREKPSEDSSISEDQDKDKVRSGKAAKKTSGKKKPVVAFRPALRSNKGSSGFKSESGESVSALAAGEPAPLSMNFDDCFADGMDSDMAEYYEKGDEKEKGKAKAQLPGWRPGMTSDKEKNQ